MKPLLGCHRDIFHPSINSARGRVSKCLHSPFLEQWKSEHLLESAVPHALLNTTKPNNQYSNKDLCLTDLRLCLWFIFSVRQQGNKKSLKLVINSNYRPKTLNLAKFFLNLEVWGCVFKKLPSAKQEKKFPLPISTALPARFSRKN